MSRTPDAGSARPNVPSRLAAAGDEARPSKPHTLERQAASAVQEARCPKQAPLGFLLRKDQLARPGASLAELRAIDAARERSIDFRTRHYGKFPGFGHRRDNAHPPRYYARVTRFMGLPVLVHEKIVPALACVEQALLRECANSPYRPAHLCGLREHNTFADYEVSNHVYGIAIDIDPGKNPCCGCLGRWSQEPSCRHRTAPVWERMAMPECWVRVFEQFGFYWLGHDELEDTMHFEFLGDPEQSLDTGSLEQGSSPGHAGQPLERPEACR